ncbi:TPA: hypothetical protein ACH3X1_001609 [Trebouxia sp. C0004]
MDLLSLGDVDVMCQGTRPASRHHVETARSALYRFSGTFYGASVSSLITYGSVRPLSVAQVERLPTSTMPALLPSLLPLLMSKFISGGAPELWRL